ncbi:hypothetical protein NU10_00955 [Flavobacterium dauae]|uniref:hypothetical protein n=1 Tax=Flavobacterium dauae TaxID=1563479 RepID=UPI00101B28C9|nr:hypothetical protein [Flavobacterium dauae]WLD23990.1 hypothetical protein NU10_00955 [Flavobacterium dauae]
MIRKAVRNWQKFSFSFDEILPSGVEVFTGQKYSSEESALPETILTLRSYLIFEIIEGLKKQIQENPEKARDLLTDIVDYNNLKHTFSSELGRVMSRFS